MYFLNDVYNLTRYVGFMWSKTTQNRENWNSKRAKQKKLQTNNRFL